MKSVGNILGYIVQENTLKRSKLTSFLGFKKSNLNQNVRHDHATMQHDVSLHFGAVFLILKWGQNMKNLFCCPALDSFWCLPLWKTVLLSSSRAFSCLPPLFSCLALWKTVRLPLKKLQKAKNRLPEYTIYKKSLFQENHGNHISCVSYMPCHPSFEPVFQFLEFCEFVNSELFFTKLSEIHFPSKLD